MSEPGSFLRIAGLQLDRLRKLADRLEAGEADVPSSRQAEGALRRFLLVAQESAPAGARRAIERLVADFAALAGLERASEACPERGERTPDRNREGAALLRSRADEIERELSREESPAPGAEPPVATVAAPAPGVLVPLRGPIDRAFEVGRRVSLELARPVEWRCAGRATEIEEGLATWLEGHLAHLVSNAVRHGVELEVERE
ncbi:MAG: hypothetical protein HY720_08785, partial [Planctomycetes bacterium]|nr:hypothetical protein [Planctomycetota bacterium]